MSTRFAPDFTQVSAGMKIFARGEYELTVTKVKPLAYYKRDEDGELTDTFISGCQVNVEMVGRLQNDGTLDRTDEGESVVPLRLYVHNQKGWGMTKSAIMAILGFTLEEEEAFNADHKEDDFSVDGEGDEATLGSAWSSLTGQHVIVRLDTRMFKNRPQQDTGALTPVR